MTSFRVQSYNPLQRRDRMKQVPSFFLSYGLSSYASPSPWLSTWPSGRLSCCFGRLPMEVVCNPPANRIGRWDWWQIGMITNGRSNGRLESTQIYIYSHDGFLLVTVRFAISLFILWCVCCCILCCEWIFYLSQWRKILQFWKNVVLLQNFFEP